MLQTIAMSAHKVIAHLGTLTVFARYMRLPAHTELCFNLVGLIAKDTETTERSTFLCYADSF